MTPSSFAVAANAAPAAHPVAAPAAHPLGAAAHAQAVTQPLTVPPIVVPHTAIATNAPWLTHGIAGLFVLSAIGLIVLLAMQTTKQEGLSGTIGGKVESAYRGRLGADEQLKRITGFTAVTFVVTAFVLSLTGI